MPEHRASTAAEWRTELRATAALAWPLSLANLLQMLTYAIDVIFIARLGEEPLAASAIVVALFGMVLWALSGLTGAVAPLIAEELGARAPALRAVRRIVRMGLWLAVLAGTGGMALCLLLGPLMRLTGQQPEIIALAQSYNLLIVWTMVPMLANNVLRSFVSALGRPILATVITGLGIGVNAAANYAFIFGNWGAPALGLPGAAVATIVTALVSLAAYLLAIRLDPKLHRYHVFGRCWRPDYARLRKILWVGTPIGLTITAEAGIFGAAAFMMGAVGTAQLAAHTIALQIAALTFQVPFGIGQAATIRVGYNFGARDRAGIGRAGWTAIGLGAGFMGVMAMAILAAPSLWLSIYVDPYAPANGVMIGYALAFLKVAAAFQLMDGMQAVAAGALRGLQDTRIPMWIAAFAYWVPGIGTAIVLGFATPLEGLGIWVGLAVGLAVAATLLTWRWACREKLALTRSQVLPSQSEAHPVR